MLVKEVIAEWQAEPPRTGKQVRREWQLNLAGTALSNDGNPYVLGYPDDPKRSVEFHPVKGLRLFYYSKLLEDHEAMQRFEEVRHYYRKDIKKVKPQVSNDLLIHLINTLPRIFYGSVSIPAEVLAAFCQDLVMFRGKLQYTFTPTVFIAEEVIAELEFATDGWYTQYIKERKAA